MRSQTPAHGCDLLPCTHPSSSVPLVGSCHESRFPFLIQEQPHAPYTVLCADFQQLQPVGPGGLCEQFCRRMETVELDTIYRSTDAEHLLFQRRTCETQPMKGVLREYFKGRHWEPQSLDWCVRRCPMPAKIARYEDSALSPRHR